MTVERLPTAGSSIGAFVAQVVEITAPATFHDRRLYLKRRAGEMAPAE
jgi:hypothetical protein